MMKMRTSKNQKFAYLLLSILMVFFLNHPIQSVSGIELDAIIEIDGNEELKEFCIQENGFLTNPIPIKNKIFTSSKSGISIQNTDIPILISNCSMDGLQSSNNSIGIILLNCVNIMITNCSIVNFGSGILMDDSAFIDISDCHIGFNLRFGMYISDSDFIGIHSNNVFKNQVYGMDLRDVDNSIISENTISFNGKDGIILEYSESNDILNNEISNNDGFGIYLFRSNYNTVRDNILNENGDNSIISHDCVENYIHVHSTSAPSDDDTSGIDDLLEDPDPNYVLWYTTIFSSLVSLGLFSRYRMKIVNFIKKSR